MLCSVSSYFLFSISRCLLASASTACICNECQMLKLDIWKFQCHSDIRRLPSNQTELPLTQLKLHNMALIKAEVLSQRNTRVRYFKRRYLCYTSSYVFSRGNSNSIVDQIIPKKRKNRQSAFISLSKWKSTGIREGPQGKCVLLKVCRMADIRHGIKETYLCVLGVREQNI